MAMHAINGRRTAGWTTVEPGASARRLFDVVASLALLVVAVPLIVVLAVVLAVTLRAWPFFTQDRIGRGGERFRFLKLRTLPPTAPAYADKYALDQVAIPPFARALRQTHLDELPQLFLVLAGHMSLVGPRPEMPHLHERFDDGHRRAREAMRPGCTGIWQVSVDNDRLISEAPQYDHWYAGNASLRLDLWILWRTARLVFSTSRVRLDLVPSSLSAAAANAKAAAHATIDLRESPGVLTAA